MLAALPLYQTTFLTFGCFGAKHCYGYKAFYLQAVNEIIKKEKGRSYDSKYKPCGTGSTVLHFACR